MTSRLDLLLDDISRICRAHSDAWTRGGTVVARIVKHPKRGECLRLDITWPEHAAWEVRFIPPRAFADCILLSTGVVVTGMVEAILRGAIMVSGNDLLDGKDVR